MSLQDIVTENHYPIVFIGSGMSKRFLDSFPSWNELLTEYWQKIGEKQNFFSFLHEITEQHPAESKTEQDFIANVQAASYIERKFNQLFFDEKISIEGLNLETAQTQRISPFKKDVANRFTKYSLRSGNNAEYSLFVAMLQKARMIVTTNHDTFLEDSITNYSDQKPTVFVGRNSFFDSSDGWSEIYKIHGSVTEPNSIVITAKDYDLYDRNSVLVSAKILTSMIDSPIIFFGYSMTDRNVRKVLDDFSSQLPQEDPRKSANRIFVVERDEGQDNVNEMIVSDPSLHNLTYTLIKTDNFTKVFSTITHINEGATPYEVKRFEGLIKKLIVGKGQAGALSAVLVSPTQLDDVAKEIDQGKPIVVALGDEKYLYVYPDLIQYIKTYLSSSNNYAPGMALSFAARAGNRYTKIPFAKYWNSTDKQSLAIAHKDLAKLNKKIESYGTFEKAKNSVIPANRTSFTSLADIQAQKYPLTRTIDTVSWNVGRLPMKDVTQFVDSQMDSFYAQLVHGSNSFTSSMRRLLVIIDLHEHGDMVPYQGIQKSQ